MRRFLLSGLLVVFSAVSAFAQSDFERWLDETIWPRASEIGVSRKTFDLALSGFQPQTRGKKSPRTTQAEFQAPGRYFREDGLKARAERGQRLARQNARALRAMETEFGVPGRIVLAIWGRESDFGQAALSHNAIEVLAERAFQGPRRAFFQNELIAALRLAQNGLAPKRLRSSFAGAMGQPQFMPSNYLKFARDGDGDGQADIWSSEADTIRSIGAFLKHHGWANGRDWGYEVVIPKGVSCTLEGPDQAMAIRDWVTMGVTRVSGKAFPPQELGQYGSLLLPAGTNGPAFIVTPNFYVLKAYNQSDLYALYVGHLADRIAYGMLMFRGKWGQVGKFDSVQIARLQNSLIRRGADVGGADGLVGLKTRRSIGLWQERNGRDATGFPDRQTIRELAQR